MKVPQIFVPERDLTDKIKEYMSPNIPVKEYTNPSIPKKIKSGPIIYDKSLIEMLANKIDKENQQLYNRMVKTMLNKLGYHKIVLKKR